MAADGQEWGEEAVLAMGVMEKKLKNTLPIYGNKESMNMNSMILTNIVGSPYFKEELINYKTFHEVIDEVYYKVDHVEPWEKNSRKLAGQVGMCAGVRGVAAGGIVSTAYCLLFKLFTLKLTRKQLNAMLNHTDSPYIRALGFMYIRYCQPPADFWDWFEPYIDDAEEIDLKAGGGYKVTIGEMCRMMLTKLDWFGTLFPRLPVSVGKDLEQKIKQAKQAARESEMISNAESAPPAENQWGEAGRIAQAVERKSRSPLRRRSRSKSRDRRRSRERRERSRSRDRERRERSRSRDRERERDRGRHRSRSRSRGRRRSRSRDRRRSRSRDRERKNRRSRSRERKRSSSKERRRSRSRDGRRRSRSRERRGSSRERKRSRSKDRERRRSPSRDKKQRKRSNSRERN